MAAAGYPHEGVSPPTVHIYMKKPQHDVTTPTRRPEPGPFPFAAEWKRWRAGTAKHKLAPEV